MSDFVPSAMFETCHGTKNTSAGPLRLRIRVAEKSRLALEGTVMNHIPSVSSKDVVFCSEKVRAAADLCSQEHMQKPSFESLVLLDHLNVGGGEVCVE